MDSSESLLPQLLQQARQGDRAALEDLLSRYRHYVELLVRYRCRGAWQGRVDSSDLVQETLLKVAQSIPQFAGNDLPAWQGWLKRIAEREVIRVLREHLGTAKRDARRELPLAHGPHLADSHMEDWLARTLSTPSLAMARKERAARLFDLLAQLPDDYREVLVLRHLEELDFPTIAERLGRTPGAVRVLWVRALQKLREQTQGELSL